MKKISIAFCLFATIFLFSQACSSPKAAPTASEGARQVIAALNARDTNALLNLISFGECKNANDSLGVHYMTMLFYTGMVKENAFMTNKIVSETLCPTKDSALVSVWARNAKGDTTIVKMPMVMNGVWKLDLVKAIRAGM